MHDQPTSRKALILTALTQMLQQPTAARITTAALAQHLGQSEAALYRHFPNKAAMFDALISTVEAQLLEDLNHINATQTSGRAQLRRHVQALLLFSERHPGLTRVLTGDALVTENNKLQLRVNTLIDDIQALLARSAQLAINAHELPKDTTAAHTANLLMHWVLGRWLRYTQTAWQTLPTTQCAQHLDLIGL